MDDMSSGDDSDAEPMSMEMLEDIHDGSQSHPSIKRIEACYKRRDCIKQDNRNGKERYYQRKTWVKVYINCLNLLLFIFCKIYQFWVNLDQEFLT